jgi:hypothetical protein
VRFALTRLIYRDRARFARFRGGLIRVIPFDPGLSGIGQIRQRFVVALGFYHQAAKAVARVFIR